MSGMQIKWLYPDNVRFSPPVPRLRPLDKRQVLQRTIPLVTDARQLVTQTGGPLILATTVTQTDWGFLRLQCWDGMHYAGDPPALGLMNGKLFRGFTWQFTEAGLSHVEVEQTGIALPDKGLVCAMILPTVSGPYIVRSLFVESGDEADDNPLRHYRAHIDRWRFGRTSGFIFIEPELTTLSSLRFTCFPGT